MTDSLPPLPPLPPPNIRLPTRTGGRPGGWLSLILHLILILVLVEVTRGGLWWNPPAEEGPPLDRTGGGGGGRQVTMVALAETPAPKAPPVAPKVPPVVPISAPVVTPLVIPPPLLTPPPDTVPKAPEGTATAPAATTTTGTGTGTGTGGGSGTGAGSGTGPGVGPGTGPGRSDTVRSAARDPEPRQLILIPFEYPASMRGRTISVTFFVEADGRVHHVLFSEDIPDRGYAKKLEAAMLAYLFRPARSAAGLPVKGHTSVSITF